MAETMPSPAQPAGGKRRLWIAIVAVIVAVVVVGAVAAVIFFLPPRTLQVELWYNSDGHYGDTEPAVAQILKDSLERTGKITVTLRSEPWATYTQDFSAGRLPMFLLGWYPDYFDPDNYVSPFLSPSGARSLGSFYNDSEMAQLVTSQSATLDPAVRGPIFEDIQDKLAEDVPYIPLWQTGAQVVYDNDMTDVTLHPVTFKWSIVDKPGSTSITVGTTDDPTSFDPAAAYDFFSIEIINQVFDTLLVYEPEEPDLLPGLATTVPTVANGGISADATSYTYNLRTGVQFHDGSDFNATVMKWSLERAMDLDIAGSAAYILYDVAKIESIETPDDSTITINLEQPFQFLNEVMAFSVSAPVSMMAYNNTGQQDDEVGMIIGTGPYELTEFVRGTRVTLEANTNYYNPNLYDSFGIGPIPVMDTVVTNLYATATQLKQAVESGAINVAFRTLNPEDITDLETRAATLGITVDLGLDPQIRYIVFNVQTPPFNDVRVRQAIAYAVNRTDIVERAFGGLASPLFSMVPPIMPYSLPIFETVYGSEPDLAAANALLSAIGFTVLDRNMMARGRE